MRKEYTSIVGINPADTNTALLYETGITASYLLHLYISNVDPANAAIATVYIVPEGETAVTKNSITVPVAVSSNVKLEIPLGGATKVYVKASAANDLVFVGGLES